MSRLSLLLAALAVAACSFDPSGVSERLDGAIGSFDAQSVDGPEPNAVRRLISISPPTLSGPVLMFPVAIKLSNDASLRDEASADGTDVLFTLGDGTLLAAEIVSFDQVSGDLLAWVNVPSLLGETELNLFYGVGNVAPTSTLADVWGAADVVWHLDRLDSTSTPDSSGNGRDGQMFVSEAPSAAEGIHGSAADYDDGDEIFHGDSNVMNPGSGSLTVSLFFNQQGTLGSRDLAFYKGGYGSSISNPGFDMELGSGSWYANVGDGQGSNYRQALFGGSGTLGAAWHHLAMVVDRGAQRLITYVDGAMVTSIEIVSLGSLSTSIDSRIGDSNASINGILDEFRYYPSARSADWLSLEAANGLSDAFVEVGEAGPATYPTP